MTAPEKAQTKARKGDLVLVERVTRDFVIGQGSQQRTAYDFGLVASATREGVVKTFRAVGWGDSLLSESAEPIRHARCWVMYAKTVDVNGVLVAAKAHHWEGHPGQAKAFDTFDDAKAVAARFRVQQ